MRLAAMASVVAVLLAAPAVARAEAGSTLADFQYTREVMAKRTQDFGSPNSPFSQLSKATREWIRAEVGRQAENPRPVVEVALDVDNALAKDAAKLSRKHRIDPQDITLSVVLMVMAEAEKMEAKVLRAARKSGDAAALEAAKTRLAEAAARRKEALAMQSQVSLALAMM